MHYKFRGKSVITNQWVYGSLLQREDSLGPLSIIEVQHKFPHEPEQVHVVSETVGMWTGLKDKNGADVYEGDTYVTDGDETNYKVMFVAGAFVGGLSEEPDDCMPLGWDVEGDEVNPDLPNWFKVIGNIHDKVNPASGQSGVNNMLHDPNATQQEPANQEAVNAQESAAQDVATEATESAEEGSIEG